MSDRTFRVLDVVDAMEALDIDERIRDDLYEAVEEYMVVNAEQLNDAMKGVGLNLAQRRALKQRLLDGPTAAALPSRPHTAEVGTQTVTAPYCNFCTLWHKFRVFSRLPLPPPEPAAGAPAPHLIL